MDNSLVNLNILLQQFFHQTKIAVQRNGNGRENRKSHKHEQKTATFHCEPLFFLQFQIQDMARFCFVTGI